MEHFMITDSKKKVLYISLTFYLCISRVSAAKAKHRLVITESETLEDKLQELAYVSESFSDSTTTNILQT